MTVDPEACRREVLGLKDWLLIDDATPAPTRSALAKAVRQSARLLAQDAPGTSVEVRVPPFVAVQCIEGPRHTRGTPPNVVECDPRTWLRLVVGAISLAEAQRQHLIEVSGTRAGEIEKFLPLIRV